MFCKFGVALCNRHFLSARRVVHVLLLLSLLLGYARAPLQAAPPEPLEPEIAEPVGINQPGSDPDAGVPEFVEAPPAEEESLAPLTYEEIEAAGSLQAWPQERLSPPTPAPLKTEAAAEGLLPALSLTPDGDEEPAIVEIDEDLPDSAFTPAWDEPWDDVPELAPDAFAEEEATDALAGASLLQLGSTLNLYMPLIQIDAAELPDSIMQRRLVPGTVDVASDLEAAILQAVINAPEIALYISDFAITDQSNIGDRYFISVIGLAGTYTGDDWNLIDNGAWFGLVIVEPDNNGWDAAMEGTEEFSRMLAAVPEEVLNAASKQSLDPQLRASAVQSYAFPWESGYWMNYGSEGVHDNGFSGVTGSSWLAVDLLSDGNTGAGHAPNRLLAAASGSIGYKCTSNNGGTSTAIRIGDLMYTHLLNSGSIYSGRWVSQGEELGQMKSGNFNDGNCGYATQGSSWFHVHLGFPSSSSLQLGSWSLNVGDQRWYNGSESRGSGDWLQANGGGNCPAPQQNSPGDGETVSSRTVNFSWQSVNCGQGFTFRVKDTSSMDSGGTTLIDTGVGGTSRTETFGSEWDNRDLYWGVKAANVANAQWAVRRFRISPDNPPPGSCDSPGADQVAIFQDPDYRGGCNLLGIGEYSSPSAFPNVGNDNASSLRVGGNVRAVLFENEGFGGRSESFESDRSNLAGTGIGDSVVSSVKVERRPPPNNCPQNTPNSDQAILFADTRYGGACAVLGFGEHPNPGYFGAVGNDNVSSIRVGSGSRLTLCRDDSYQGGCDTFEADDEDLGNNGIGNNNASSARVEQRVYPPGIPSLASPPDGALFDEGQPVAFSWSSAANAVNYAGEISGGPQVYTFGWQAETAYTTASLPAGYQYTWHVRAGNGVAASDWSESRTFTVRPGAPTNLTTTSPSCANVNVTWGDGSSSEDSYRIYRNGNLVGQVGDNVTTFSQTSVPAGAYTYNVYAYRGSIASVSSNNAQVTVAGCAPPADLTTSVSPAMQVHDGATRVATRFTLRESAGTPVQIRSYTNRWYSATGAVALSSTSTPVTLTRSIPGGGFITWSTGLLLPRSIVQQAANRGESAVRLYMTFRGVDSANRPVSTNAYVTLQLSACGDATEPNNAAAKAKAVAYGQTLAGAMCPSGELDLFTFNGAAGDPVRIAARQQGTATTLDPKLELLGSDGRTVLAMNNDRAPDHGQRDARIAFVLPATGKYYVRVTDAARRGGVGQTYDLLLHKDASPPVAAIQVFATGKWLHAKQQIIRVAASDRQTEIDHVQFFVLLPGAGAWQFLGSDATAADGWQFAWDTSRLPAQSGYSLYVFAIDGAGNNGGAGMYDLRLERTPPVAKASARASYGDAPFRAFTIDWSGRDSGSGILNYDIQVRKGTTGAWTTWITATTALQARYAGAASQTYYFRTRARDKTGNVSALAGGNGDASYTVRVCAVAGDGYETDDTAAAAKAVRSDGSRYRHNFHAEGNADWIKFTATAGAMYTLRTYSVGKHADTVLALYKSDGKTVLASNDDWLNAGGPSKIEWKAPAAGTYYARVTHHDRYGYGCTTTYDIAVLKGTRQIGANYSDADNVVDGELAPPGDEAPVEELLAENAVEWREQLFLPLLWR